MKKTKTKTKQNKTSLFQNWQVHLFADNMSKLKNLKDLLLTD